MVAKRTQHVAPNNVAICCVDMLRSFGRGFRKKRLKIVSYSLGNALGESVHVQRKNLSQSEKNTLFLLPIRGKSKKK